jgi:hypothetical protein
VGKNPAVMNSNFQKKVAVLSLHIVTVIFNQLNIKKKIILERKKSCGETL